MYIPHFLQQTLFKNISPSKIDCTKSMSLPGIMLNTLGCTTFALSLTCSCNLYAEKTIKSPEFLFKNYNACFLLYHVNQDKMVSEYNPNNRCYQRIAPDSTFKIAFSLMAFNQGIINPKTVFKWDGVQRELPGWNQDQTPNSWLKYSVLWVSQRIALELGETRIKHYLDAFNYGNKDFSGDLGKKNGLQYAWLSSSLKISAFEQLTFLKELLAHQLPLSPEAYSNTENNLYLGTLDNGFAYYGKTGSGINGRNERLKNPSKLRDGWFIGYIINKQEQYIFVSNLTDKTVPKENNKLYGSQILKPLVLELLNNYFLLEQ